MPCKSVSRGRVPCASRTSAKELLAAHPVGDWVPSICIYSLIAHLLLPSPVKKEWPHERVSMLNSLEEMFEGDFYGLKMSCCEVLLYFLEGYSFYASEVYFVETEHR